MTGPEQMWQWALPTSDYKVAAADQTGHFCKLPNQVSQYIGTFRTVTDKSKSLLNCPDSVASS